MTERRILNIEEMLAADDVQYVEIPAWGGLVRIGSLDASAMMDWLEGNDDPAQNKVSGLRLLCLSLVDGEGNRIGTMEHVEGFKKKDANTTGRLVQRAMQLNGLIPRAAAMAAEKNASGEAPTDASPTA